MRSIPKSVSITVEDDELSTGVAVTISIMVTFIITLVITSLITLIITSLYYKHLIKESFIRQEGDSHAVTKSIDPAYATITRVNITMDPNQAYGTATAIKMNTNPTYASAESL